MCDQNVIPRIINMIRNFKFDEFDYKTSSNTDKKLE